MPKMTRLQERYLRNPNIRLSDARKARLGITPAMERKVAKDMEKQAKKQAGTEAKTVPVEEPSPQTEVVRSSKDNAKRRKAKTEDRQSDRSS